MESHFEHDIGELKQRLLTMAGHAETAVNLALQALLNRDYDLALRVKERTGRGQAIDVSMLEGQLSLLGTMIGGYLADGELPEPMGTAYKALLPYQTFRTKTRDLALAVGSEKLWKVFCPVIGRPELTDDPEDKLSAKGPPPGGYTVRVPSDAPEQWPAVPR